MNRAVLVWFLLLLQIPLAAWIWQNNDGDDALTLTFLESRLFPAPIKVGSTLPSVPVFDRNGKRVFLYNTAKDQTILFSGCTCDLADTAELAQQAAMRGENLIVVLRTEPSQLEHYIMTRRLPGRVVAVRRMDLCFLRSETLPAGFLITQNGLVASRLH